MVHRTSMRVSFKTCFADLESRCKYITIELLKSYETRLVNKVEQRNTVPRRLVTSSFVYSLTFAVETSFIHYLGTRESRYPRHNYKFLILNASLKMRHDTDTTN